MQTIVFDDFGIWDGRCTPADEPFSTDLAPVPPPAWPTLRTDFSAPTSFAAAMEFDKTFTGGGCGKLVVTNNGAEDCARFEAHVNIDPAFGGIGERGGEPLINNLQIEDMDAAAGALPAAFCCVTKTRQLRSVVLQQRRGRCAASCVLL